MELFQSEYDDGIADLIQANASISYASALSPCENNSQTKRLFKSLASVSDTDLYYTQSILVSSSWNKNDDIFDKEEIWKARNTPEHKPTNLEHDESTIIGHIVSNWPITEDGILIDENTPIENLPEKYHILTGSVIYKSYTKSELKERTAKLIAEIEDGTKYVSMECFFQGFDYGLINKSNGSFTVLPRDSSTAHLTKYLRAYGGMGEHDNYKIGRVLRNITFSGKGFVDRPANPDSIIFSKDNFKFTNNSNLEQKNDDFVKSGVINSQSSNNSENITMSESTEVVKASDCAEVSAAAEATATELKNTIETMKTEHEATLAALVAQNEQLTVEHEEAAKKTKEEKDKMTATIQELETKLAEATNTVAVYMKKEKKMARVKVLMSKGFEADRAEAVAEKFESVNDETFDSMVEMISAAAPSWLAEEKKKKEKEKMTKGEEAAEADITEVLENVEETSEVAITVGGEDDSAIETTRAALVDFVCTRLGKKLNKGE